MDRRVFLAGLGGALAGCYAPPPAERLEFPLDLGVDAHVHLFNGRDVPAMGILRRVILSGADALAPGTPLESLARLLVWILGAGTPTAAEELDGYPRRTVSDDERAVAQGLDAFIAQAVMQPMRQGGPAGDRDDARLLRMLLAELGIGPEVMAQGLQAPGGAELARRLYHPEAQPMAGMKAAGPARLGSFLQWAGLLTRRRRDLLAEVLRLYRGEDAGQLQVLFASLVDLEFWLEGDDHADWLSPLDDQLAVMARLSRDRRDALIVNFAPFCPLRAAIEGPGAMARLQRAVDQQGFAGVKLYPPMGFRPTCNAGNDPPRTDVTAQQIDAALTALYCWCAGHDVPIQAHANDSMAARPGAGAHASPVYWERVLQRHPGLRVNLSHAGYRATGHSAAPTVCGIAPEGDWLAVIARMIGNGQSVWLDTGYWVEAALGRAGGPDPLRGDPARAGMLARRMLYGSDWSMIGLEPGFAGFHRGMQGYLLDLFGDAAQAARIMGANALAFLLGPKRGLNWQRLDAFHSGNAVWQRHFAG